MYFTLWVSILKNKNQCFTTSHPFGNALIFVVKVNAKKSLHYFRRLQGHFQVLEKYQISINKTDKNAINTTMQENNFVNSKR